jgi:hypothetical protein
MLSLDLQPCATMWIYNGFNTRDKCLGTCIQFTLDELPNNAPPPQCTIADCLLCDEIESGPLFQKVAARSRRRSGLLSKIARPCDAILLVNHTAPCNFTLDKTTPAPTVAPETPAPTEAPMTPSPTPEPPTSGGNARQLALTVKAFGGLMWFALGWMLN